MMPLFNRNWAGAYWGSLSWTKTAGGLNWRMSAGSGCGTLLQQEPEERRAGEGFARGRSDA